MVKIYLFTKYMSKSITKDISLSKYIYASKKNNIFYNRGLLLGIIATNLSWCFFPQTHNIFYRNIKENIKSSFYPIISRKI